MRAKHFNSNKTRYELLPVEALAEVAKVMQFGAEKYGRDNWRKGMPWLELVGSILRHIFAWLCREDNDAESGLPHLAHAATDILFLLTYALLNIGIDDRVKSEQDDDYTYSYEG